jgi:hypothetical protein
MMRQTIGSKLEELDRILNDPTAPMEAHRVWSLLDDVSDSCSPEDGRHPGGSDQVPGRS